MSDVEALRDTLIWAASGKGTPAFEQINEKRLIDGIRRHRLEARLLDRVRRTGRKLPASVEDPLVERHRSNVQLMREQIDLYARLRTALAEVAPHVGVAPVKGFGLFALTGDEKHTRFSFDLDVIGGDPASVAQAARLLGDKGYHHHGEDHPYVYAHMDLVEVHSRYLVTGFPADALAEDYEVATQPGVMRLQQPFSVSSIEYADVAKNLVDSPAGPVLAPEMAAIIRCAHIYVGYAMDPDPLPVATVRLDELCQLSDLVALESFDADRFQALARKFDADLVVSFARTLCQELFGTDPFEAAGKADRIGPVTRSWYPQNLWWDGIGAGFPVRLDWSPRELVARSESRPDLVRSLSPTVVQVGPEGRARVSMLSTAPDEASRYFWHRFNGGIDPVEVEFVLSDNGLRTVVTLPAASDEQMSAVGVASGETRVELFFKPRDGKSEFADYSFNPLPDRTAGGRGVVTGKSDVLTVDLPWTAFGRNGRPAAADTVPVILRVRQQDLPWHDIAGAAVAPLMLNC
jgi:hypothetical protein